MAVLPQREAVQGIGPGSTKEMAEDLRAEEIRKVRRQEIDGPAPERITFEAFADEFFRMTYATARSADRFKGVIKLLKSEWNGLNLDAITPQRIEAYKAKRQARRDAATVIKDVQVIKRLFRAAHAWGRLRQNPALAVKAPKAPAGRKAWIAPQKFADLMGELPDWLQPLARFQWATGDRRSEALNLFWRDVDLKAGTAIFRNSKNGEDRTQYLNATARAVLESMPAGISGDVPVFPVPPTDGKRVKGNLTPAQERQRLLNAYKVKISRAWREACIKVGLLTLDDRGRGSNRFRLHDVRHQAASDLRRKGADLWAVQTFLGHKSPVMAQRYAEIQPDDARRIADALDSGTAQNWPQSKSKSA